jgi:tRNA threonylcarbamoyladenosine biosynthesis protein TsaE
VEYQSYQVRTSSPEDTASLAVSLAPTLAPGAVLILEGELGAGKTTFVKGLAAGLGLEDRPRSPSYTLVREYGALVHVDLYRLSDEDAARLGLEEYLDGLRILAIEWGTQLPAAFWGNAEVINIRFTILGPEERSLVFRVPAGSPSAFTRLLEGAACV